MELKTVRFFCCTLYFNLPVLYMKLPLGVCSKQEMWKITFQFHHSLSISNRASTTWLLFLKPTMVELCRILVRLLVMVLVLVVLRVTLPVGLIAPSCVLYVRWQVLTRLVYRTCMSFPTYTFYPPWFILGASLL